MGREIRRVPARWSHPNEVNERDNKLQFKPLYHGEFDEAYKEWEKELVDWYEGYKLWHEDGKVKHYGGEISTVKETVQSVIDRWERENLTPYHVHEIALIRTGQAGYEWYSGRPPSPPSPGDYMPYGKWYQLYETVSEGTPLSPPFKTKEQLVEWLSNNKDFWGHTWTPEQAAAMVRDEYAPSMVMSGGKVYTAEESTLL